MHYKKLFVACLSCLLLLSAKPQSTTGGISGTVKTNTGAPLWGAGVQLLHDPTGSLYTTKTRGDGSFTINNINPGGPYTIEVSFASYIKEKKTGIYIALGDHLPIDIVLTMQTVHLGNVTVTANSRTKEHVFKNGMGSIITEDRIAMLPSTGSNLHNYLRSVPQAKLLSGNEEAVSIAGQNNRFNSFYIDGAISNDVFGLAASGTNGGQAGISVVSMEAVNQFQVTISPFDASLGNFTGAGINAVTRSGTNRTEGSVYYSFSNASLIGKTPTGLKEDAAKADGFSMQNFGARLQGAVTKNKLFYFINIEIQKDVKPQAFDFNNYTGDTKTANTLTILSNTLKANYQYDAGNFLHNDETMDATRMLLRFDWNIHPKHKLTFSNRYTQGQRINTNVSKPDLIHFSNDGYLLATTTYSVAVELKSVTGKNAGNKLLVSSTYVNDNRDPLAHPFPRVRINDGDGAFIFGTDNSSTINLLTQNNWTLFDKYNFIAGRHEMSMGIDCEYSKVFNAFIQSTFGSYTYASLGDFFTNDHPSYYQYGFPARDQNNNDHTSAAAVFSVCRNALFINDQLKVSRDLTLHYGARLDQYLFLTKPYTDDYVNETGLPQFARYWNTQGAGSGMRTVVPLSFSPRLGFTMMLPVYHITLRGGTGIFTGRIPLAWPGGSYQNNGSFTGGYTATRAELGHIRFRADPYQQWTPQDLGATANKQSLNLTAATFSMPKTARVTFAVDVKVNNNWSCTAEAMFTKNLNEIYYTNINLLPPTATAVGADNRYVYSIVNAGKIPLQPDGSNPFENAILLSNKKDRTGYTHNVTASIAKHDPDGISLECSYNFCRSMIINDGTSSVNMSQWRFMETVNGRNYITLSQSDFSAGHRLFALASKHFRDGQRRLTTSISISYTGESGSPFSYVYGNASMTRDDGTGGGNDLIYIPTTNDLSQMIFLPYAIGNNIVTQQQQKELLEKFIASDHYLRDRRGRYAERNGARTPFTHSIDLAIKETFIIRLSGKKYRLQVSYDVFNIGNLLNRDWGRKYFQQNDAVALVEFAGYISETDLTPQYRFNPSAGNLAVSNSLSPAYSARWMSRLGVKIIFN